MGTAVKEMVEKTGLPRCTVEKQGVALTVVLRTQGLLAAGGRFEVVPVFGPVPPVREEQWTMTVGSDGIDSHRMKTAVKDLDGDGINFQVNLCTLHPQFADGVVEVAVEQDGADRPIVPPMRFTLEDVAPCQSASAKLTPTVVTGGFAFVFA